MILRALFYGLFMLTVPCALYALPEGRGLPEFQMEDVPPPASATNLWFHVGENMTYDISWGIFNVGQTEATTRWIRHPDGRILLLIRFETHSNRIIEAIYPIEDIQESVIDPETFLPLYFYKKSRQGNRLYDELVTFNHANRTALWENFARNRKLTVGVNEDSRDIITTMYYLRSPDRIVNEDTTLKVYTDEKIYDLQVDVMESENIKLEKYGRVMSIKYEPIASFEGMFVSKGRMFLWVSQDERKICTKIQATLPVADVRLTLKDVDGPGDDFWVAPDEDSDDESNRRGPRHRRR